VPSPLRGTKSWAEKSRKSQSPAPFEKSSSLRDPREPEKAEISVHGADELYREIRIENALENEEGKKVGMKEGAPVDVTIEAEEKHTTPPKK